MRGFIAFIALSLGLLASAAEAQPVVGNCHIPSLNRTFAINSNLWVWQVGYPQNGGFAARDPSGVTYLMLPSSIPAQLAYFVAWNGALIEVVNGWGWQVVGSCSIAVPSPPAVYFPQASPTYGVPVPGGLAALPGPIVNPAQPFGLPLIATPQDALTCAQTQPDASSREFQECMVAKMLGTRERAVYDCARQHDDAPLTASCVVAALGGANERRVAAEFSRCYQQANGSYQSFAVCMAGNQFSADQATLVQCISQQSQTGQVSVMGTAVCYGAQRLDLNPEAQIIIQCAVATGGEPEAFAGCAGGQLTARELQKCQTGGIGGPNGCFGPNNDVVQYMRGAGLRLAEIYGPLNPLVRQWNEGVDRIIGGARDQGVRLLRDAANTAASAATQAAQQAGNAIQRVVPRITVGRPKVSIGGRRFSL